MDLGIAGRRALVTGGSRGIGRGIAEALAAEGADVVTAARHGADLTYDAADLDAIGPLCDAAGEVDVLILNTGGPPLDADPLAFGAADWELAHRTLVIAPMLLLKRLLPPMRERGWGRVVAVSSSAAREPLPGLQLSNANRPGLLAGLKHLAREAAADGVTLNAVLPGRIWTDRLSASHGDPEAAGEGVPAGRAGSVEEIAAVATFLCSDRAAYVTGQSVLVDGGLTRSW